MKAQEKPGIYITGIGQLKVEKESPLSIRQMGAKAIKLAMEDAGIERADAIYLGNMLSGIMSNQQQLGPLVANEAGLFGTESVTLEAACGSGGAAVRAGIMAIMSGFCETVIVCGLEKMSHANKDFITKAIATASDWETEGGKGETFVTLNAKLMRMYIDTYKISPDSFGMFGVNAHRNAFVNPNALFRKEITLEQYLESKFIADPVRIYDASPVCDGAAAIVLSKYPSKKFKTTNSPEVKITASAVSTDFVGIGDRNSPLMAEGLRRSGQKAYAMAGITAKDVDFFELHDAYSIISTLSLEAMGFAEPGQGWKLAADGKILRDGQIPISTFGGLKARGHAIGASGVYQTVEAYLQLTDRAMENQIKKEVNVGLIQSIGGTASTTITHVLVKE
ncbi:MAG TPA: beta-ketoacyl synthase N-terminal-like domain-containing protein [Bacteroidia bacterium]|jgi:acetyl-CoA C-acetyltransferase|nr:beta-ketoacyl synthase N-terminal-like domain-containing protein [Bacteroidia bacterium]